MENRGLSPDEVDIRDVTAGAGAGRLPKMAGRNDSAPEPDEWELEA